MPRLILLLLSTLLAGGLVSCESTNQLLKAKPAPLSRFIEKPAQMRPARERLPVHNAWSSPDAAVRHRANEKRQIYVAPVQLAYLRPLKKPLVRYQVEHGDIRRNEREMATRLRNAFANAFLKSEHPRYLLAQKPNSYSVTLELAIVELNPTSPKGNMVKTAAKFVVGPLSAIGGYFTKGNIAIEGKVRNSSTGELIFQFADSEQDKMTFYSLRDYKPYGHAIHAIGEWAAQFELFTRTPPHQKIDDTFCFTLDPL